jgi:hypothetical protein
VGDGLPDMEFIRNEVPIFEVAVDLGIRLASATTAQCWRTDQHKNGDRTPSMHFHNNRCRCFVCDGKSMTTIDLVQTHEGCSLFDAIAWICLRFDVPTIAKNQKLARPKRWQIGRVGAAHFPLEELILSGLWADFDDATRAILPVLCRFADSSTKQVQISYRGIARYSGKRSDSTIASSLRKLEQIGLLKVSREKSTGTFRECGRYRFDWDNPHFQSLLRKSLEQTKTEADGERALRAQARIRKSRTLFTTPKCELEKTQTQKASHYSRVECALSEDATNQTLNNFPVWKTPTFLEIPLLNLPASVLRSEQELRCDVHGAKATFWLRGEDFLCEQCHPDPHKPLGVN